MITKLGASIDVSICHQAKQSKVNTVKFKSVHHLKREKVTGVQRRGSPSAFILRVVIISGEA